MKIHRFAFLITAASALMTASSNSARALLIDDFTHGSVTLTAPPVVSNNQTDLSSNDVLGGAREIAFDALSPVTMSVNTAIHTFSYSVTSSSAIDFSLTYNGNAPATGYNLNLTAGGATGIDLDFAFNGTTGGNPGHLDVFFNSTNGAVQGQIYEFVPVPQSSTPFTLYIPFNPANSSSTFDPTHTTSISIGTSNGNLPTNFALTRIYTAPEPSSLLLLASPLALLLRRRPGNP